MIIKRMVVGPIQTNCYILYSGDEAAVIDPGGGAQRIIEEIKASGKKLKYIINTHYHFDHNIGNLEIQDALGGDILIHEAEKDFIGFPVYGFLEDGDELKIGEETLKVIHTPGHTFGGICLIGPDYIFTGDTLFKNAHGRTDLPGGSDEDMKNSLKKLSKIIKRGMAVYPGHGEIYTN